MHAGLQAGQPSWRAHLQQRVRDSEQNRGLLAAADADEDTVLWSPAWK